MAVPEADLDETLVEELVDESVELLAEARNLFLAGGPVMARIAGQLSQKTIATHDLVIAMAAASAGNDVVMIGREVDNPTLTLRSSNLEQELSSHFFDYVVLEVDGIDEQNLWVSRKNHAPLASLLEARSDALLAVVKTKKKGETMAESFTSLCRAPCRPDPAPPVAGRRRRTVGHIWP